MKFDPEVFGEGFHAFVQMEYELFGNLSLFFHIFTFAILYLVFRFGNKFRRLFSVYFTVNWILLFCYWGVYGLFYWLDIGIVYLAVYIAAPILLALIVYNWIKELIHPEIDLDVIASYKWKFAVLIIVVWGLWYPSYIYGHGFNFELKDFLFSYYGLMPCPTTMVVLGIMTLKYPAGNKKLFNSLTVYAIFIGTATVMSGWFPDIPFVVLGVYSLILILSSKRKKG